MKKTLKKEKGITLIALVITIVILLILAGISISALTQTGLFSRAKQAEQKSKEAEQNQTTTLGTYEKEINQYVAEELTNDKIDKVLSKTENTVLKDLKGNVFTVPAGFKVTNDATTVDKGIVIEDATETVTKGSQFVWIPVGTITKADGTTAEIKLNRYLFDKDGKATIYSGSYVEEDINDKSTLKNIENKAIAKNIKNFKNSVTANGGYYIGRYEARTATARKNKNDELTQITEKGTDQVYNYVTQKQAAEQSQNMYNSNKFTSDLINSYAWDTAIIFIQNSTNQTKYSRQNSLNKSLEQTGTTNDKQCNIFDMSSNVLEWTTETTGNSKFPCADRGGIYSNSDYYTSMRASWYNAYDSTYDHGFRPILYL